MMFPSSYFKRVEFQCRCGCGFNTVDVELLAVLNDLRFSVHEAIYVNSACRCLEYNRKIGSNDTSQHVQGKAADIRAKGITPKEIHEYLNERYPDQ